MDLLFLLLFEAALGCESIGFNFDTTDSAALFEGCENTRCRRLDTSLYR